VIALLADNGLNAGVSWVVRVAGVTSAFFSELTVVFLLLLLVVVVALAKTLAIPPV
jgi:hypothetical protein